MSRTFEFPANRDLKFPERCMNCGQPKETEVSMEVNRLVLKNNKQIKHSVTWSIPLCNRCKRVDQGVFLYSLLAFVLGLLAFGIGCFIFLALFDNRTGFLNSLTENIPGRGSLWLPLVASLSFLVGLAGGFLVEAVAKVLAIPMLGRALYNAPLLVKQMLGDVSYTAGLNAHLSQDGSTVQMKLFNEDVANVFESLNSEPVADVKPKRSRGKVNQ
jgi:hypothetical protein